MRGRSMARQIAVLVAVACVLGGCSGSDGRRAPSAPPTGDDPGWRSVPAACALVDREIVDRLVGAGVRPQRRGASCTWSLQDITAELSRSVGVEIQRFTGGGSLGPAEQATQEFHTQRWLGGERQTPVEGYGDEAVLVRGYTLDDRSSRLVVRTRNVVLAATAGSADTVLDRAYRALPFAALDAGALEVGRAALTAISAGASTAAPAAPSGGAGSGAPPAAGSPASAAPPRAPSPAAGGDTSSPADGGAATAAPACGAVPEALVEPLVPAAAPADATAPDSRLRSRCVWQQFGALPASKLWATVEVAVPAAHTDTDGSAVAGSLLASLRDTVDWRPSAPQVQPADEAFGWEHGDDQERTVLVVARRGAAFVEIRYTSGSGAVDSAHPALAGAVMTASAAAVAAAVLTAQQARTG